MIRLAATALVIAAFSSPVSAKEIFANCMWPAQHFFCGQILKPWAEDVAKVTEGRVIVTVPASSLAPPPKQVESIRGGLFDAGVTFNGFLVDELTGQMVSMLPFTGSDDARATSIALWATYSEHLQQLDEFDGLHLLSAFVAPGGDFYSLNDTPITGLASATDRKMWALPGAAAGLLTGNGGNVVSGPAVQMGEIVQSGVVDGFVGIPPLDAGKFNALQYAKSVTITEKKIMNPSFSFMISDAAWADISPEDRAAIMAISGAAFAEKTGALWTRLNDAEVAKLPDRMAVHRADESFEAELAVAAKPAIDGWLGKMQAAGRDGQAVLGFYLNQVKSNSKR